MVPYRDKFLEFSEPQPGEALLPVRGTDENPGGALAREVSTRQDRCAAVTGWSFEDGVPMPADPISERSTVRAVAQAGNAVALFAILLVLVNSTLLFTATAPLPPPKIGAPESGRLLFVVIDGLRADAVTPARMPRVHALAQRGALRTSRVETLIPSTIAGLRALIEGVIVPPAEFVSDFRSRRAPGGGLIEAVHRSGGRVFVAGPHLWTDLYGQWIDGSLSVQGLARDDLPVLRAAMGASRDPQWKLVAVQFCRPDVMAHMHGAASREYAESVAWCDRAIGDLVRSVGNGTLVVITSDHGVTVAGGHAGTEADVLRTPLIASDASFATRLPETISQAHVPHLLAEALGPSLPASEKMAAPHLLPSSVFLSIAAVLAGALAVLGLLGTSADAHPPRNTAFGLNASVWVCIAMAWLSRGAGCALAFTSLMAHAWWPRSRIPRFAVSGFVGGIAVGAVRIAVPASLSGTGASSQPSLLMIFAICLIAFGFGYIAARKCHAGSTIRLIWLGAGIITLAPALSGFLGESVSLSTLDMRLAFHLFERSTGLAAAVLVAAIRPFLPLLFLLAGVIYCWRKQERPEPRIAALGAGAGAVIAGELVLASLLLASGTSQFLSGLALGLLLRECALIAVFFPVLAGAAIFLRTPDKLCHNPAGARSRAFHQT